MKLPYFISFQILVPLHRGEHAAQPARPAEPREPEQVPQPLPQRHDAPNQVHESPEVAEDAAGARLLLPLPGPQEAHGALLRLLLRQGR